MILHARIYLPEKITTRLWSYALKAFAEKLNKIKVNDGGITPKDKVEGKKTYITLKNHHIWGCPVYVLDARFQGNITGIPKWEPH